MTAERQEILQLIRTELAAEKGVDPTLVVEGASFSEELGLDSLDLVELRMELEDRYEVRVPDEVLMDVRTVSDAIDAVISVAPAGVRASG
jgi:acyl carrier protein